MLCRAGCTDPPIPHLPLLDIGAGLVAPWLDTPMGRPQRNDREQEKHGEGHGHQQSQSG